MAKKRKTTAAILALKEEEDKIPKTQHKEQDITTIQQTQHIQQQNSESESDEETKKQNIRNLLEPFTKEQIIDIIKEAAIDHTSLIIKRIKKEAESDPNQRKIFVYGLGYDATQDHLLDAFKVFGEIQHFKLVTDKLTGRAKGYAFLQFTNLKSALKALKQPQKKIGSRIATCQLASMGGAASGSGCAASPLEGRRLYVGNVGPTVNVEKIKSFFARFGEIEEGPIGIDAKSGKFKGYAIFVFKTVEGFKKALEEPTKVFEGVPLQCRPANKNQPGGGASTSAVQQPSMAPIANYGGVVQQPSMAPIANYGGVQPSGVVPGMSFVNPGFNPAALMMAQGQGLGLANPLMGLSGNGFGPSMGYGLGGMNPGMMGSFGSYPAMQALGAYQSLQMGQSSAGATPVTGAGQRPQTGLGPLGSSGGSYTSFGR